MINPQLHMCQRIIVVIMSVDLSISDNSTAMASESTQHRLSAHFSTTLVDKHELNL